MPGAVVGRQIQLKLAGQRHQRLFLREHRHHRAVCAQLHQRPAAANQRHNLFNRIVSADHGGGKFAHRVTDGVIRLQSLGAPVRRHGDFKGNDGWLRPGHLLQLRRVGIKHRVAQGGREHFTTGGKTAFQRVGKHLRTLAHGVAHGPPVRALPGKQPHLLTADAVAAINRRPGLFSSPGAKGSGGIII